MNIISLGAGVQSSTVALMAKHREILPMPDYAIFGDTQVEPRAVYEWLNWLEKWLPFPVVRVTAGNLGADLVKAAGSGKRVDNPPFFTASGPIKQDCTSHYKIAPIRKYIRAARVKHTVLWLGISTDEAGRMKDSNVKYITNRYPLIEKLMSRRDCLAWMKRHGYPEPPKSACIFCPWTSAARWRERKLKYPEEFEYAVGIDRAIRDGVAGLDNQLFVHRSLIPLDQVDFSTAEDHGQINMFNNECEGICGV